MSVKRNNPNENNAAVQHPDYCHEIAAIACSNLTPRLMKEKISDYHENDIADALELLKKDERLRLYSILDNDMLSDILEYSDRRDAWLGELSIKKRVEVLNRFEVTTAIEYLRQLDKKQRSVLIELMEDGAKKEIAFSSAFDEDEIGSRMTTNYIAIHNGLNVKQAMKELVDQAAENDNISTIYVLDEDKVLVGAIELKDLIVARESTELDSIIMTSYPYVYAEEQIEDCIERLQDYSEDSIPVLDENNKLKGILTAQDVGQMIHDVLGDDYAKLAGLAAEEDLEEPLKKSISKRLPWLMVLLGLGLVVSTVVGIFEKVVAHLALIVCFQSLVLDMAGNVGTQSLAVTIRVLMDEQVSRKQKLYLISKEARVGLCNGLILGALSFVFIGLYLYLLKGQMPIMAFSISACTGMALLVAMLLSSVVGTTVPMLFKQLKVDPAVASGPLITTINDLVAVVTYYGLSWVLIINVLQL
ncbi:MAG: magnesium transporter [Bariatricus sp.]|nr:magnesium transporter [Bariatricus sp.]